LIHKFEMDNIKIILDVNSGAVHVVDNLAWDIIDDFDNINKVDILNKYRTKYKAEAITETISEISDLKNQGLLFSKDKYFDSAVFENGSLVLKSMCLNISHDCNLSCRYCFAGSGHFGGMRALMPYETGQQAIKFLLEKSVGRRHLEIDFFGGEPLMNIGVVEKLVYYSRETAALQNKEIKFTLTTNALLLNEKVTDFLNQEKISVVLSLDGRPETNDTMRTVAGSGKGSYDSIMPRISAFIKSRNNKNYYVRGTYTRFNRDFAKDVLHLADLGYKYISVEPVVGSPSEEWALREEDMPELYHQYDELIREYFNRLKEGRGFDFFHFNLDLNHGPCLPKRLSGCGAGHEYMAVTPEGEIYPCHQFVGREKYKLGSIFKGIENTEMVTEFRKAHIYNKQKCLECWAKFHCGGGCHANAEFAGGTIDEPYGVGCGLEKKRLECAIYAQVLKAGNNEI
jgi:uncharacterized protein